MVKENSVTSVADEGEMTCCVKSTHEGPAIKIVAFVEHIGIENCKWPTSLKEVSVMCLEFTRSHSTLLIENVGFPSSKILGVGLIDGRNAWKVDRTLDHDVLGRPSVSVSSIRIQPSVPL